MPALRSVDGGVRVALRVTPKAARDKIEGIVTAADGEEVLKVAVSAPPEDGKANDAVIKLLAKNWKLPKRAFTVISGATARTKQILIATPDGAALLAEISSKIAR